ncbi:MAG: Coenzyme F420 hydrogenase/dehydrogenase, beta subunit C-terminal domain [Alphaproteobacteria bacterium]|nr:Coenzyme F420 hydrogenase/dehydrogenase, beta subunit C-terminal domain [Alphaproteobacteria bacterium]
MKNNVNLKVSTEDCCGCGACANKCGVKAITMKENDEGFLYPVIDEDTCINCGQCLNVCPVLNSEFDNTKNPECYAVMASDEIREKSSSGGMFTLLAEHILNKSGVVCGAAFDEKWNVHHIIIDNADDLDKLRGSKYVQSDTEKCYSEIEKLLKGGKEVLFSGTPCQVAGLNTFLGKKYDNLLTVDILCHGAPSRGVWQKYLDECFDRSQIKNVNFRDKSKIGWSCSSCTFTMANGNKIVSDSYTKLFHNSTILRKSCENCKYSLLPRPADITLGDWWGISEHVPGLNDGKGLSLVLANTAKGKAVVAEVAPDARSIQMKENYNNGHIRIGTKLNPARNSFFMLYRKDGFRQAAEISTKDKYDVCLITTFFAKNFGAIMVAYAVHNILTQLKQKVLMLQKLSYIWPGYPLENTIPMNFARKHYTISRIYNNIDDLVHLNQHCKAFIVGSDQLFKPSLHQEPAFLDFVKNIKNKISFATSFGDDAFRDDEFVTQKRKYSFRRFNHISLREDGSNIEQIFNLNAQELIDPTLMLDVSEYIKLTANVDKLTDKPFLVTYILDANAEKYKAIDYVARKLGLEVININNPEEKHQRTVAGIVYQKDVTPEKFLWYYKNASFVITDSYHGTCFATKFNKPFISFINLARGGLRYKLFDLLKLKERIVANPSDVYNNDALLQPFDFTQTNRIVKEKADFAINWLKNALANNNAAEKFTDEEIYLDTQIKELRLKNWENEQKINKITEQNAELKKTNILLALRYEILHKYYFCKFMALITFGDKKKKYRDKYLELKPVVKKIRLLIDSERI